MRRVALVLILLLVPACATQTQELSQKPVPATPQPAASDLREGLAVDYYYGTFNHIRDLEGFMDYKPGKAGTPIRTLSHDMDAGTVLTSEAADFVGAHITGYLRLDATGTYRFQITNNDGVRVHLGGARIHDDPGTGPARTSDPIPVEVTEPGWYALEIWYFEKRGTAVLEIVWSPPGEGAMTNLPVDAMKHR